MPFVFNGVTIPENVANAFSFNGTDITDVFFNGVQVWHQSLFTAQWSANSIATGQYVSIGIQVSGNLWRQYTSSSGVGAWITTNLDGTFSGNSTAYFTITTSGHSITLGADWVTHDVNTKQFSGMTTGGPSWDDEYFMTSGGLIAARYVEFIDAYGAWVSLT